MDATLLIPPVTLSEEAATELRALAREFEAGPDWDSPFDPSLIGTGRLTDLRTREGDQQLADKAMAIARKHKLALAVHLDGTHANGTYEWDDKSFLTWHDPETGKDHENPAGNSSLRPHVSFETAARLAQGDPEALGILAAMKRVLGPLEIL